MERYCLISNRVAGSGSAGAYIDRVKALMENRGVDFEIRETQYPGHATELAKAAVDEGFDVIVAVGGDGTLRETALSVVHTDRVLGLLPCGTGNDYARPLGIPTDAEAALDILLNGETRTVDAGMANDQIFFNIAGFGFDVDVLDYTEEFKPKCRNGETAYRLGCLKAVLGLKLRRSTLTFPDGTIERNVLMAAAGVGTHFGGGMNVLPESDMSDGLLDVCIAHDVKRIGVLKLLPKFIKGKHLGLKCITYRKATEVSVVCDPVSRIEVDGERMDGTPVTFRILPGALKVRAPKSN
ncbi:MAG: diacylglycerol kinase family lipid kinase [Clostridia bacterium]|nr:diacylglycerol kinase family lipid kinase [Clostridia bacterium]MDO4835329.1 diacylglycerol kinase family lipid kinase [Clostridia bacterium]